MALLKNIQRVQYALCLLLLVMFASEALAQTFNKKMSMRTWENDMLVFQKEVIGVLDEKFSNEPCTDMRMGAFLNIYLDQLETIRDRLSSMSFLILRNVASAVGEELVPHSSEIRCSDFDRWKLVKSHFESKIRFVGSIFALLELSGAL